MSNPAMADAQSRLRSFADQPEAWHRKYHNSPEAIQHLAEDAGEVLALIGAEWDGDYTLPDLPTRAMVYAGQGVKLDPKKSFEADGSLCEGAVERLWKAMRDAWLMPDVDTRDWYNETQTDATGEDQNASVAMRQRRLATCEVGHWRPMHEGCPECGPSGPCKDPTYEQLIQWCALPWWRRLFTRRPQA